MNSKLFALFALLAVLFGSVAAENIKLHVYESTSKHWVAVKPVGDDDATAKIELIEATSDDWIEMLHNTEWGYWQMWSSNPEGFSLPISFRLTSQDGDEILMDNLMNKISGGDLIESGMKFSRKVARQSSPDDDNSGYGRPGVTGRPYWCPTEGPNAPPQPPPATQAPATQAPATQAPATQAPARPPPATAAPTSRPTTPPATAAPTQRPTAAPTQRPTAAPTQRPTAAPTTRPTAAPTQKPTAAPTTRPTSAPSTDLCAVTSTKSEPVKVLVPLYMEPGSGWDALITAANAGTSIIAVINPNSGPVSSGPPSNWVTYMNKMKAANIDMVGYVHTSYGARSISDVKKEIDTYASKYAGLKGIFLDEVSAKAADIPYYKQAYDYIMSKSGYIHDILNPGASTDQGYLAVSSNIVVYEASAASFKVPTASFIKCAPSQSQKAGYKYKFSAIIYGASSSQMTTMAKQLSDAGVGMVFITDKTLPNPYNPLPSYFASEASTVKNL